VDGVRRPTLAQAGVRLVALVTVLACLFSVVISSSAAAQSAACAGDEQIVLAPSAPRVAGRLMVAVFSHAAHEQGMLLGPDGPIPVVRTQIGDSFLWQEMVALNRVGENVFVFGIGNGAAPFTRCVDATVYVDGVAALFPSDPFRPRVSSGTGQSQPVDGAGPPGAMDEPAAEPPDGDVPPGAPTPTRRPTRTPTPKPKSDNGNENDNEATATPVPTSTRVPTATREPTATRTPRPPATDTPEPTSTPMPTPTLGPPSVGEISPARATCGQALSIDGERFGSSRNAVDGQVRIDGREATIDSWSMTRIQIKVPLTVRAGNDRELEVVVSGRRVTRSVGISC
jgi:hypothetical protein